MLSSPDAIGIVLERRIKSGGNNTEASEVSHYLQGELLAVRDFENEQENTNINVAGQCPDCAGMLIYQDGWHICHACGYTKCS